MIWHGAVCRFQSCRMKLGENEFQGDGGFHPPYLLELYGEKIEKSIIALMQIFEHEYNEVWTKEYNLLEKWLEENDERLEKKKNG